MSCMTDSRVPCNMHLFCDPCLEPWCLEVPLSTFLFLWALETYLSKPAQVYFFIGDFSDIQEALIKSLSELLLYLIWKFSMLACLTFEKLTFSHISYK